MNEYPLLTPQNLIDAFPYSLKAQETVNLARQETIDILSGKNRRLVVVLGPCSIHDTHAALDYANRLQGITTKYKKQLHLIMRVYFEKPRTTTGWKGLINDPYLDSTHKVNDGLMMARKLLSDITDLGVPIATEFMDLFSHHYISDFISWGAIGARTSESQPHRELASSLPMAIGFKNNTSGNVTIAINAVKAAAHSHHCYSINRQGSTIIRKTDGNSHGHVILRGSYHGKNYDAKNVDHVVLLLKEKHLSPFIMIDCSHGNSFNEHEQQMDVAYAVSEQIAAGNKSIAGVMIESFLEEGKQVLQNKKDLLYGQSITDACISWEQTIALLDLLADSIEKRK